MDLNGWEKNLSLGQMEWSGFLVNAQLESKFHSTVMNETYAQRQRVNGKELHCEKERYKSRRVFIVVSKRGMSRSLQPFESGLLPVKVAVTLILEQLLVEIIF
ncbi:hypothetical protein AVEN_154688-1 [Araneus ventricosus]|uniref:Uncharacterized protein n=1 Tax=Araneus ventricosus TaxID=182803 RepID=A0A4Y2VMY9_ARAVE|nr:hypothetical protein AVEN_78682-1 [Araneus ventricosus]GBO25429.1 hypothetical protein AVEN_148763-1 [Araneus ventricosus]GBO25776.1 hypothetical protein AVEN_140582-1 [Araneus ventricosus]GBO25778.1 hypothetical protein AVEN_154688-1 [Araneus ventricosus]